MATTKIGSDLNPEYRRYPAPYRDCPAADGSNDAEHRDAERVHT